MKKQVFTVTVDEGLITLDSSLVITVAQNAMVSTRQSEIDKIVISEFDALGTVLPGAFARNTMIQPLQDNVIDLYVLLEPERGQINTPGGLMRKLEAVINLHYPDAHIVKSGLFILLEYPEFSFHIAPSFFRENKGYILANAKSQKWLKNDPSIHYYALDEANVQHKGLLIPVIRIVKYWNRCNGALFNDYYLELLVKEILSEIKSKSYTQAIKHIFKKAIRLVVFTINDPADPGKQMDGLRDIEKMLEAMFCFQDCHAHIVQAEHYERKGDLLSMYKEWGKIFGGEFPSYIDIMAKKLEANGITGVKALQILRDAT